MLQLVNNITVKCGAIGLCKCIPFITETVLQTTENSLQTSLLISLQTKSFETALLIKLHACGTNYVFYYSLD